MEFGIFQSAHVPKQDTEEAWRAREHERILDEVAMAEIADRTSFKYAWLTEHHFLEEYSHLSASEVFGGFLAARTKRLHIGSGIWNLTPPVNAPARIAERVAMMDHLSEGRFEFGVGRGSSSTEYQGFGIPDGDTTRAMIEETLPEILRMMRPGRYRHQGRWFSMPERLVLPKPYTQPHPPLWIACGSPSTFEKAGRLGLGALCFTIGPPEVLAPLIETYKKAIREAEPVGGYVNDNVACVSRLLCLEDGDEARRTACDMRSGYYQSLVFRWLDSIQRPPGIPEWPALIPEPDLDAIREQVAQGLLCAGDPEDCARGVQRYVDIGCDQLIFGVLASSLDRETAGRSLETFGRQVIPRFDRDPVHSTTRQREAQLGAPASVLRPRTARPDSTRSSLPT
ncbi:MAG: LLM class flavin-dependent oxidoreductase [Deltaproteobacteria bacterium]|nr:LLM class flavin-dependent oxidoreductase [Deltaproteobacteria bacterium]